MYNQNHIHINLSPENNLAKFYVIATGDTVTSSTMEWLYNIYASDTTYHNAYTEINNYMNLQYAANNYNLTTTISKLYQNATGELKNDTFINTLIDNYIHDKGIDSWEKLFSYWATNDAKDSTATALAQHTKTLSAPIFESSNHNTYTVGQAVIDLGEYGQLFNPIHINNSWFYAWDMNGDGKHNGGKNNNAKYNFDGEIIKSSGSAFEYDFVKHDVLDALFNQDINGVINTSIQNIDGEYGTTNQYRYTTLNGVKLALPTTGTGNLSETLDWYYLTDNQSYTDLAEIWDSYNTGYKTKGVPTEWRDGSYWASTPNTYGHAKVMLDYAYVGNTHVTDDSVSFVALEVL